MEKTGGNFFLKFGQVCILKGEVEQKAGSMRRNFMGVTALLTEYSAAKN